MKISLVWRDACSMKYCLIRRSRKDVRFGESLRGDESLEELRRREDRLAAIRAAKACLEAA